MPRRKKEEQPQEEIKKIKRPPLIEGMKDVLPSDIKYWDFVEGGVESIIHDYSFQRMETPIIEKYELFNHTLYKQSGLLDKEAFSFIDKGQKVALRPDVTPSVARSYIEHNMLNQPIPVKVYSWGPVFRHGKVEQNKLRQFTQINLDVLGEKAPAIDAELIIIASNFLQNLGLQTKVKLNSVGCAVCRPEYKKALGGFLKTKRTALCADCRKSVGRDPYSFLTCESAKCQHLREEAPQTVDWLCDECRNHLFRVLEYLDIHKISYELSASLLNNFDYYTKTVFEILSANGEDNNKPLVGGGRYDYLVQMLSGPETPSAGLSLGVERIVNQLKTEKIDVPSLPGPDVYFTQLSEQARQKGFAFFEKLRQEKFSVKANFSKASLKSQLDMAIKLGAKFVLILGQKEVAENTIILRDVESGIQEVLNVDKVIKELNKRLVDNVSKSKK